MTHEHDTLVKVLQVTTLVGNLLRQDKTTAMHGAINLAQVGNHNIAAVNNLPALGGAREVARLAAVDPLELAITVGDDLIEVDAALLEAATAGVAVGDQEAVVTIRPQTGAAGRQVVVAPVHLLVVASMRVTATHGLLRGRRMVLLLLPAATIFLLTPAAILVFTATPLLVVVAVTVLLVLLTTTAFLFLTAALLLFLLLLLLLLLFLLVLAVVGVTQRRAAEREAEGTGGAVAQHLLPARAIGVARCLLVALVVRLVALVVFFPVPADLVTVEALDALDAELLALADAHVVAAQRLAVDLVGVDGVGVDRVRRDGSVRRLRVVLREQRLLPRDLGLLAGDAARIDDAGVDVGRGYGAGVQVAADGVALAVDGALAIVDHSGGVVAHVGG